MLKKMKYDILVVSSGEKFNINVNKLISLSIDADVTTSLSISQAQRLVLERSFDVVIIDSPVGTENGCEFALSLSDSGVGVMLFAKAEDYNEAYDKVHEFGVYVLARPTDRDVFIQSLRVVCSLRDRITTISKNPQSFKEKLEEIKVVNEAKLLLIKYKSLKEDDAHNVIVHHAMNLRTSKKCAAELIIKELNRVNGNK